MASSDDRSMAASVVEAAAKLWTVQEPKDAIRGLRLLQEALLHQSQFGFDPSDVAISIQSSSLRFEKKSSSETNNRYGRRNSNKPVNNITYEDRWSLLQASMWAMAALARVCVGPAWRNQALRRRVRSRTNPHPRHPHQRQTTPTTLPDDSSSNLDITSSADSSGSWDPQETEENNPLRSEDPAPLLYPPIPEKLPLAMLRFAADAIEKASGLETKIPISFEERMKLVEAQFTIIQHLCCAHQSTVDYDREPMDWNIPGAYGQVGKVLATGLKLVCTGRSKALKQDAQLLSFVVSDEDMGQEGERSSEGSTRKSKSRAKGKMVSWSPVVKDQWKYILLLTRATTDLLSSGWRPLPQGRVGHDVILSLLVIAARGIKLQDLHASRDDTSTKAREERLVATSCAAEALSGLLSLTSRGLIPTALQRTLVRTICRLHVQLSATIGNVSNLLYPLFGDDRLSNTLPSSNSEEEDESDHQVAFFASQRELCLTDTSEVQWAMLSNESSVEQSVDVFFSIIEAAILALRNKDSTDSPIFNKLKWNDQTGDFFMADCVSVVGVLNAALWGHAPDFAWVPLLRIFWHGAIEASCKLLSVVYSEFATSAELKRQKKSRSGVVVVRSNYFTKQVRPLVVEAIAGLQRAIDAELRQGGGLLSVVEWDAMVDGIENAVIPWLRCSSQFRSGATGARSDTIQAGTEALLLRVAELLDHCAHVGTAPLMEYPSLRRLFLCLLAGTTVLDRTNATIVDLSVVRAWSKFGFFPYRLEGWSETASELLGEVFKRQNAVFSCSPSVRLEALASLTSEDTSTEHDNAETNELQPQSLLVVTKTMPEMYLEVVSKSILPVLKLVLADERRDEMPGVDGDSDGAKTDARNDHAFVSGSEEGKNEQHDSNALNNAGGSVEDPVAIQHTKIACELQLYAVDLTGRLFLDGLLDQDHRSACIAILKSAAMVRSNWQEDGQPPERSVRLGTLHQLGLLLEKLFGSMSLANESAPLVVGAICQILVAAVETLTHDNFQEPVALATAALRTLEGFHLRSNNTLRFLPKADMSLQQQHETSNNASQLPRGDFKPSLTSKRTAVVLNAVITALFQVLRKTRHGSPKQDEESQAKLSSLRTVSFGLLSSFLVEGVLVVPPFDFGEIIGASLTEGPEDEESAKLQTLSGIVEQLVALRTLRTNTLTTTLDPAENQAMELMTKSCQIYNQDSTIRFCRTVLALAPSIRTAVDISAVIEVQRSLLARLETESFNFLSSTGESPLVAALLATVCETPFLPEGNPDSMQMRAFKVCSKVIGATYRTDRNLALHMALRCTLKTINILSPDEAEAARDHFTSSYNKHQTAAASGFTEEVFAPSVIIQALEQHCQPQMMLQSKNPGGGLSIMSRFHALSIECDNLDSFPVEEDPSGSVPPSAAWLFDNNVVLSCRLGSSTSRCRGHIEIVLRSPMHRKRLLIPIPGAIALEDPEFPCLVRYGPKLREVPHQDNSHANLIKTDSTLVLDEARSVLERFDTIFSPDIESLSTLPLDGKDLAGFGQAMSDDELGLALPDGAYTLPVGDSTELTASATVEACEPDPTVSSPERLDPSPVLTPIDPAEGCLQEWIIAAFGWNSGFGCDETHDDDPYLRLDDHLQQYGISFSNDSDRCAFHNHKLHTNKGKRLQYSTNLERAICILDRTAPLNTYKFSLLYLGHQQNTNEMTPEARLLGTKHSSPAFYCFAKELGDMVPTRHLRYYSAGLDASAYESDGRYTLAWLAPDDAEAIVFHVAHFMPEGLNGRKRHIGNDNVLIVFVDESSEYIAPIVDKTYAGPIVSGHFNFGTIFVKRLPQPGLFCVSCRVRAGLCAETDAALVLFAGDNILSDVSVAPFVRSLAIAMDVACRTSVDGLPPATNCLDRARQLFEMKRYEL